MKLEPGWYAVFAAIAIFYIRLLQLRGRRKRETREEIMAIAKANSRRKKGDQPLRPPGEKVMFQVRSWVIIVAGAVVMLAGLGFHNSTFYPPIAPYWWAFTTAGIILFTFGFK